MKRRKFFRIAATGSAGLMVSHKMFPAILNQDQDLKPKTNIADAMKHPRTKDSMPGRHPGQVVQITHPGAVVDDTPVEEAAYKMIADGLMSLTGKKNLKKAWTSLVSKTDRIGLKVNPVAGTLLTTSHAVTKSIIRQLEEAGIPRENLVIFDRREFQLHETGFTKENYPGIRITGTECKDEEGSFLNDNGELYSLDRIDKDWYYWADCEMEYNEATMPFMVNSGKYSYFCKTVTQELDKIINVPILKNAGASVTLCMKNLGYGVISNTSRLHAKLWGDTSAEVCAFPPIRDKVVLNIVDGLIGCFDKGPGANPQFITNYNTILIGTDPVAVDRIGYDIVIKKRIEEGIQTKDSPRGREFMEMAAKLKLGVADIDKIKLEKISLA